MERIGLVAGSGNFPVTFAEEARKKNAKIIAFGIEGITSPDFGNFVDKIHWINPQKFQIMKFAFLLMSERIKKIVLVGKVDKTLLFGKFGQNKDVQHVLDRSKDQRDYSILEQVTKLLKKAGVEVVGGLEYLNDLLPEKGILTKRLPSEKEKTDIEFGFKIAKELTRLDIGQTVTVKNKAVVTVEALEGTDEAIKRATPLVGEDFTVVKVARPNQDMRWDVPVVGLSTIETMIEAKARVLAVESKKMFFVDKEKVVQKADLNELTIVVI